MNRTKMVFRVIAVLLMFLLVQQVGSSIIGMIYYLFNSDMLEAVQADPSLAQDQAWLMEQMTNPGALAAIAGFGLAIGSLFYILIMRLSRLAVGDWHPCNWQCILWGVLLIIPMSIISNVATELMQLENMMGDVISSLMRDPWGIASIALFGPIAEEVCFRSGLLGLFIKTAREQCNPRLITTGLIVQAVLFGAIHINPPQVVFATVLGLLIGFVYYRTGSIIPCIVMHVLNNSSAVMMYYLFPDDDSVIHVMGGSVVTGIVCAVCLLAIWILITRYVYYPPVEEKQ